MSLRQSILDHDTREVWRILQEIKDFTNRDELFLLPFLSYDDDLTKILLSFNYDLNLFQNGSYVIHLAAWAGNTSLVTVLLKRGASINLLDEKGNTPLHLGCLTSLKMVQILVNSGVDVHAVNDGGLTAIEIVRKSSHVNTEIVTYLEEITGTDEFNWMEMIIAKFGYCFR